VSFGKLTAFVIARSMAYFGFVAFVPLYAVEVLHASPAVGDMLLTLFLLSGVFGTLSGGPVADRVGRRTVLLYSTAGAAILTVVFVAATHGGSFLYRTGSASHPASRSGLRSRWAARSLRC
jgi:FSR family fosmidomycin resistance protein-like MFS transporter